MNHLAQIQTEFIKRAGFMGLKHWGESDNAADFVSLLQETIKKGKDINKLIEKELKEKGNEYNTCGAENVALAMEDEGKTESNEDMIGHYSRPWVTDWNAVPKFSHLINKGNFKNLIEKLKEVYKDTDFKKDVGRMLKHVERKSQKIFSGKSITQLDKRHAESMLQKAMKRHDNEAVKFWQQVIKNKSK